MAKRTAAKSSLVVRSTTTAAMFEKLTQDGRITSVRIPYRTCYPGDPVTDHESLCTFLGSLYSRIESLEHRLDALNENTTAVPMADPIRTALERLVARLDETTDCNGPIPAWSDSCYAARAALAQPAPPAEGEVAKLVSLVRQSAVAWEPDVCLLGNMTARQLARAADLLERGQSTLHRLHRLQQESARFREPERTILCDILANGTMLPDPDGKRYGAPQPVPVSEQLPGEIEQALIKAECALSDIAEGEAEESEGDPLEWAEKRAADALARIRPVMRQRQIQTSEWPPFPAHAMPIPTTTTETTDD